MGDVRVRVGVGVWVIKGDQVLMGQRRGAHGAGTWAPPGGHIEAWESAAETAVREVEEETGLVIKSPRIVGLTEDMFAEEGKHYVTLWLVAHWISGEPVIREPTKCSQLCWADLDDLPQPLFLTVRNVLKDGGLTAAVLAEVSWGSPS